MPTLKIIEVVDSTGEDEKHPATNMLLKSNKLWLCSTKDKNHMISATFRLEYPSVISGVDLGNCGSADVSVLVSRSGMQEFKELVPPTQLRAEADCRNGTNSKGIRMFTIHQMRNDIRHGRWDLVKVNCVQPYRRSSTDQFGLAMFTIKGKVETETKSPLTSAASLEKFKETALRSSPSTKRDILHNPNLTLTDKILLAARTSPSGTDVKIDDDLFKATVISFLESKKKQECSAADLKQQFEHQLGMTLSSLEYRIFMQIFRSQKSKNWSLPSRVLTPRVTNSQITSSRFAKKLQDTKMAIFKPQLDDAFGSLSSDNTQTVFLAEVVHNHSIKNGSTSFMGAIGKENTPLMLQKCNIGNDDVIVIDDSSPSKKVSSSEKKHSLDTKREGWKERSEIDKWASQQSSPDSWLKRKSDPLERSQPFSKKRPREASGMESCNGDSVCINRITPSGGWLLGNTHLKKTVSPSQTKPDEGPQFPFRVSPPPPTSRPASPLPLVDDIDQPSTSSRETVAERNIRLEMERKLAERSPSERVVQRTSSGKVKGTYCTKGMNTNDSPLRRLSICDEAEETDSPQARRKLRFARQNRGDTESMAECPVCSGFFEDIYKHLEDCFPSPLKKPDDTENDDEMACPICGLWVSKETVAAHADECAQKRYGA